MACELSEFGFSYRAKIVVNFNIDFSNKYSTVIDGTLSNKHSTVNDRTLLIQNTVVNYDE